MRPETTTMRSLLFVPGISEPMIGKARDSGADALILDLEDAVAPDQKLEARATVARALREMDFGDKEVYVRINSLSTPWGLPLGLEDARAVATAGARGIVIPKCESPYEVTTIAPVSPRGKLLCLIETPRGVLASREIVEASDAVVGLLFGTADLSREMGCVLSEDEIELLFARSHVLMAARAAGVAAYDSPHFTIADLEGLRRRSQAARNLGYDGKLLIHPSHIAVVNEIFAASAEQIADAQRVVDAMETAQASGRGVVTLDGRMIDQVHLSAAKKVLKQAR